MDFVLLLLRYLILPGISIVVLACIALFKLKVRMVDRLVYSREFSRNGVFAGEEVEIIETIYNPSMLPVFFVDVESYIHGDLKLENHSETEGMQLIISRFHLFPFTRIVRKYTVTCSRRGYYTMRSACVLTSALRMENKKYFEFHAELYVYPKLLEYGQLSNPIRFLCGSSITRHLAMRDPFSVIGVREYAAGDPFNTINFKATARSYGGGIPVIKVNQYDNCSDRVFMLYINFCPSTEGVAEEGYEALMEYGMSLAASFAYEALKNGYKVGFAANCRKANGDLKLLLPIVGGVLHIEEILREISQAQILWGVSFPSLLDDGVKRNIRETEVFILTPYTDESIEESVAMLEKNNHVTVIGL